MLSVACADREKCFLVMAVGVADRSHHLPGTVGMPDVGTYSCWTTIAFGGLEYRAGRMGCVVRHLTSSLHGVLLGLEVRVLAGPPRWLLGSLASRLVRMNGV